MTYEVPASKASIDQNQFKFKLPGDRKTYTIPKLKFLKPSLVDDIETDRKTDAIRKILDHYHPGLWDKFDDLEQAEGFFNAWAKESGVELGESSASTDS